MLGNLSKNTNITASSVIGNEIAVSMRATIGSNGTWNIVKTVRNSELYLANQQTCEADYEEFEAEVLKIAQP